MEKIELGEEVKVLVDHSENSIRISAWNSIRNLVWLSVRVSVKEEVEYKIGDEVGDSVWLSIRDDLNERRLKIENRSRRY